MLISYRPNSISLLTMLISYRLFVSLPIPWRQFVGQYWSDEAKHSNGANLTKLSVLGRYGVTHERCKIVDAPITKMSFDIKTRAMLGL
jgi:hypothetical protein